MCRKHAQTLCVKGKHIAGPEGTQLCSQRSGGRRGSEAQGQPGMSCQTLSQKKKDQGQRVSSLLIAGAMDFSVLQCRERTV